MMKVMEMHAGQVGLVETGVGTFKILLEEKDDPEAEKDLQNEKSKHNRWRRVLRLENGINAT